jgi:trehalose-6-phosphatase
MTTQIELECKLLMAEHAYRHADNNESAFQLRAQLASTTEARKEAEGAQYYYANEKIVVRARLYRLRGAIAALAID